MGHHAWPTSPWEPVDDLLRRKVVHGERMTATMYEFAAGGAFPEHAHPQEQITLVVQGNVTFTVEGVPQDVGAGELLVIPAGVVHDAVAERPATVYSTVSPSRRDGERISMQEPVR